MTKVTTTLIWRRLAQIIGFGELVHVMFLVLYAGEFVPLLVADAYSVFRVWGMDDARAKFRKFLLTGFSLGLILGFCINQFTEAHHLLSSTHLNMSLKAALKSARSWLVWNCTLVVIILLAWIMYSIFWIPNVGLYHAFYGIHFYNRLVGHLAVYQYVQEMEIEDEKPLLPSTALKDKQSPSSVATRWSCPFCQI